MNSHPQTWGVVLRNGGATQVVELPPEAQQRHGFRYYGRVDGAPHLWTETGHWREDARPHPLDIRRDSVPLLAAD